MASKAAVARRFAPGFPLRGFFGDTPAAAWTRRQPQTQPPPQPLPRIFRRGLARIPGNHLDGTQCEDLTTDWCADPYAPDDPATCFDYDEKDLESEETMWAMYGRWRSFYGVERDHDDIVRRFVHFKERARRIHEFNKSGESYTLGLQIRGDLTPEEVEEFMRPRFWRRSRIKAQ